MALTGEYQPGAWGWTDERIETAGEMTSLPRPSGVQVFFVTKKA